MDLLKILALVEKGLTALPIIIKAGQNAAPAIKALTALVTGARKDTVTPEQMQAAADLFDSQLTEFNEE